MRSTFAIATRDELWVRGERIESRLAHGAADGDGSSIEASDAFDPELVKLVEAETEEARSFAARDIDRVRFVVSARRVAGQVITTSAITFGVGELSLVSDPQHAESDRALLARLAAVPAAGEPADYRGTPLVWRGGSAAVLLHEAAGHAAEHAHTPLEWPAWLSVRDEPHASVDDLGLKPAPADLLAAARPESWRRESFRDVPLPRMSRLVATQAGAMLEEPPRRIDIHLVAHGTYEPLTEELTIRVAAADLVDGAIVRRLPPFWIREHRAHVPPAIAGATGPPIRYPGVVCSVEGQEVVVGSFAPVMMTRFE